MRSFTTGHFLTRAELMKPDAPLAAVIESFFTANHHIKPKTVLWYERFLGHFCKWVREKKKREPVLADIDKHLVDAFITDIAARPTDKYPKGSPYAARGATMVLKVFANWLRDDDILVGKNGQSVLRTVKLRDEPDGDRRPLTDTEWKTVLLASGPSGSREHALMVFIGGTGLRLSEVRLLRMSDLNIREGIVHIRAEVSKNGDAREVVFHKTVGAELDKYLRGKDRSPDAAVFPTDEGDQFSESGFNKVFQRIKDRSKVQRFSAHVLRHMWATNFMRDGGDLMTLKRLGGWKVWSMVERYSHAIRPDREKMPDPTRHVG